MSLLTDITNVAIGAGIVAGIALLGALIITSEVLTALFVVLVFGYVFWTMGALVRGDL